MTIIRHILRAQNTVICLFLINLGGFFVKKSEKIVNLYSPVANVANSYYAITVCAVGENGKWSDWSSTKTYTPDNPKNNTGAVALSISVISAKRSAWRNLSKTAHSYGNSSTSLGMTLIILLNATALFFNNNVKPLGCFTKHIFLLSLPRRHHRLTRRCRQRFFLPHPRR